MERPSMILITGSAGYCGRVLSAHLARARIPVVGLDASPEDGRTLRMDVRDAAGLKGLFDEYRPSHVIHLAHILDPTRDRGLERDVNVGGTRNVLMAADATPSVRQFVLMSSTSVYGAHPDNPAWLTEDAPLRPGGYQYAEDKREGEELCRGSMLRPDLRIVILRPCTVAGPGYTRPGGVVRTLARSPLLLAGRGGDRRIQLVHEEDLVALIGNVVHDEEITGTFNLCPDSYSTIDELGRTQRRRLVPIPLPLLGAAFRVAWKLGLAPVTPAMAPLLAHGIVASPARLADRYGYTFRYSTRQAFLDAVDRRRERGTL